MSYRAVVNVCETNYQYIGEVEGNEELVTQAFVILLSLVGELVDEIKLEVDDTTNTEIIIEDEATGLGFQFVMRV